MSTPKSAYANHERAIASATHLGMGIVIRTDIVPQANERTRETLITSRVRMEGGRMGQYTGHR